MPGWELAELTCRVCDPVATGIAHIVRFDRAMRGSAEAQGLIGGAVAEMTWEGVNPNDSFTNALAKASLAQPPPSRAPKDREARAVVTEDIWDTSKGQTGNVDNNICSQNWIQSLSWRM